MVKTGFSENLKIGLGIIPDPNDSSKELHDAPPLKATVLLPKDTLDLIDQMVKNAHVGSRGRLIQMLVDDVWTLRREYDLINRSSSEWYLTNYDWEQESSVTNKTPKESTK